MIIFVRILFQMDTKLTLKLDKEVIDKAKAYANAHQKSLSRMIESYLKSVINQESSEQNEAIEISPFVRSMQTGVRIPKDLDARSYHDHLADKYQ